MEIENVIRQIFSKNGKKYAKLTSDNIIMVYKY